jgi:hypothetical protein
MDASIVLVQDFATGSCASIHTVTGSGFRAANILRSQAGIGLPSLIGAGTAATIS